MNITINATEDTIVTINTIGESATADTTQISNPAPTEALIDNTLIIDQTTFNELMVILRSRPEVMEASRTEHEIQEEEKAQAAWEAKVREAYGDDFDQTLLKQSSPRQNDILKKQKRRPGAVQLRTSVPRIGKIRIGDGILEVFSNGYAIYDNGDRKTVIWVENCGTYTYYFGALRENEKEYMKEKEELGESVLGPLPWYHALMLAGENQIERNLEHPKSVGTTSDAGQDVERFAAPLKSWAGSCHIETPEEAVLRKEEREEMLGLLTDEQRRVFIMYYDLGYRQEEIADILGKDRSTVKTHLDRAKQKIRNWKNGQDE